MSVMNAWVTVREAVRAELKELYEQEARVRSSSLQIHEMLEMMKN